MFLFDVSLIKFIALSIFNVTGYCPFRPLAFLLGLVNDVNSMPNFEHFKPCLKPADIVYIGLRDVDAPEKRTLRKLGIKAYSVLI
jgi:arginase family enzyme